MTDSSKDSKKSLSETGVDIIEDIGDTTSKVADGIETTATTAATAVSTIEKASVILAVISAAMQIMNAVINAEAEAEKQHQEYLQGIIDLQLEYNRSLLEAKLLHDDVFGQNPFGNIIQDIRASQEAMDKYQESAMTMQKAWADPKHNFLGNLWKSVGNIIGALIS